MRTMDPVIRTLDHILVLQPVVVQPRRLVAPMLEPVPLAAALRVDMYLVVVCRDARQQGLEVDDLVFWLAPFKGRVGDVVEGPVEHHADAGLDLLFGLEGVFGRQQVQGAAVVALAVLVPEGPGAAVRHWIGIVRSSVCRV